MVIKKSIAAVAGVALLAAGYVGGAYIGIPFVDRNQMEGSIGKAKAFNETSDPEVLAAMEQLASDSAYQKQAIASAMVLSSRISQMDELTKQTIDATKDIKELEAVNESMQKLYVRTQNASKAYDAFMAESAKVINGEKSEAYEQAANNALLAFTVLENNLSACPGFIDEFADYLRENKNDNVDKVAIQWIEYCAEDAVLNNSKNQIEAWKDTYKNVANSNANLGNAQKLGQFPDMKVALDKMVKVQSPGFKVTLGSINKVQTLNNSVLLLSSLRGIDYFYAEKILKSNLLGVNLENAFGAKDGIKDPIILQGRSAIESLNASFNIIMLSSQSMIKLPAIIRSH